MQRAGLVVRAPEAGVLVLLEIDRRTEDTHELVAKLRRHWERGRLLPKDADKRTADLARSRPDAIDQLVGHEKRLWRRVYPPTGREGLVPRSCSTEAKAAGAVAVLEKAGRRYWAPRRFDTYHRGSRRRTTAVSSVGHVNGDVLFDDLDFEQHPYDPWAAYNQSKTANVLFAVEAARRWASDLITANALNPGRIPAPGSAATSGTSPTARLPSTPPAPTCRGRPSSRARQPRYSSRPRPWSRA
ncbi:hypothetical protein [Streptomyces sp. AM6-12]|uniref:hypothetical protein n=1 Tax=Streptomyces sp. AM6-12 TaxID=3345149 RepID=UPI0037B2D9D1